MKDFTKKMITIQQNLNAPKNQKNTFGNYKYRSCEDIQEALKPLLSKEGLLQIISDEIVLVDNRFYVKATVRVTDGDNEIMVSALAREAQIKKGMDEAQITGATSSYARKYALNGMWNIDDNKDADTNEQQKEIKARDKKAQDKKPPKIKYTESYLKNAITNYLETISLNPIAHIKAINSLDLKKYLSPDKIDDSYKNDLKKHIETRNLNLTEYLLSNGGEPKSEGFKNEVEEFNWLLEQYDKLNKKGK